jgi:hypothetical protein
MWGAGWGWGTGLWGGVVYAAAAPAQGFPSYNTITVDAASDVFGGPCFSVAVTSDVFGGPHFTVDGGSK